jgi:hypothetical protein
MAQLQVVNHNMKNPGFLYILSGLTMILLLSSPLRYNDQISGQFYIKAFAELQPSTSLLFEQVVASTNGKHYLIGEVQNNERDRNVESTAYFSKSDFNASYFSQDIGIVPNGMGIPFKIDIDEVKVSAGSSFNISDFKVTSRYSIQETNRLLVVDYSSLNLNSETHAISGLLDNKSPIDSFDIRVLAIAMNSHSKILDVVESKVIPKVPSGGKSPFTLVPLDSVAKNVSYYSCFVPTASGQNYTIPAGNQNIQLEVGGDGKLKYFQYDPNSRNLSFVAEGIFPGGGIEDMMVLSGPSSFADSDLVVSVNGQNITNAVSGQLIEGKVYRHITFSFPFGMNDVSVRAIEVAPEYPYPEIVAASGIFIAIALTSILVRKWHSSQFL